MGFTLENFLWVFGMAHVLYAAILLIDYFW